MERAVSWSTPTWKTSNLAGVGEWQHEAASRVERQHREDDILPTLDESACTLLRSQSGPAAVAALSATPSNPATRIDSTLFRVLLLRRLRLPLPPVSRTCRCGRLLDSFRHHRAAGVLGRRGFAVESVGARIFREGGARVATNVLVRDLDLLVPNVHDGRRLEIVAEGLPLFGGVQLVVDTTLVSPIERRRVTPSQRCCERRCRSPGCQAPQGAHIPRVGGAACASSVGCLGW